MSSGPCPLDDSRTGAAHTLEQRFDQFEAPTRFGPVTIVQLGEVRPGAGRGRNRRDGFKVDDRQPNEVVRFDITGDNCVEADDLHKDEATTTACYLGTVFE